MAHGPDPSHFDPGYFANGMSWQLPDLPMSEFSYQLARSAFEVDKRLLVNATQGGKLELLERMSLEGFVRGG
jgi:hypothetical protein